MAPGEEQLPGCGVRAQGGQRADNSGDFHNLRNLCNVRMIL
jgi:hypothetical protein